MTWYPPTRANPLPVVVVTAGQATGHSGWHPPSEQHPLPVEVITTTADLAALEARVAALEGRLGRSRPPAGVVVGLAVLTVLGLAAAAW